MSASLQETVISYLEERGWYFDWDHDTSVWGQATDAEREKRIREGHSWTLPQWGEYWSSDHLPPAGPKPKRRRYESLKDAVWSQLLREEEPETYECFYNFPGASA